MNLLAIFGFLNLSLADIVDILMVATVIFLTFRWLKGSSSMNVFVAIIGLFLLAFIAEALNMKLISSLLKTVLDVGVLALIIIFQPEIRRFLMSLGRRYGPTGRWRDLLNKLLGIKESHMDNAVIGEIAEACRQMGADRTGALIVIPGKASLTYIVETGDKVDAIVSRRLIMNIFFKNSPLHDGAMVISESRIVAARCTLPITKRDDIPAHYGMRHKAAIGMSEECDARILVVSEETGAISFVQNGRIETVTSITRLRLLLGEGAEAETSDIEHNADA